MGIPDEPGLVSFNHGQQTEGIDLARQAVDGYLRTLGPGNLETVGQMNALAEMLRERGKSEDAEAIMLKALQLQRDNPSPDQINIAEAATVLGWFYLEFKGDAERAERLLGEALQIRSRAFPADHPFVVAAKVSHGAALLDCNRAPEAEPLLREGMESDARASPRATRGGPMTRTSTAVA